MANLLKIRLEHKFYFYSHLYKTAKEQIFFQVFTTSHLRVQSETFSFKIFTDLKKKIKFNQKYFLFKKGYKSNMTREKHIHLTISINAALNMLLQIYIFKVLTNFKKNSVSFLMHNYEIESI